MSQSQQVKRPRDTETQSANKRQCETKETKEIKTAGFNLKELIVRFGRQHDIEWAPHDLDDFDVKTDDWHWEWKSCAMYTPTEQDSAVYPSVVWWEIDKKTWLLKMGVKLGDWEEDDGEVEFETIVKYSF